MSFLTLLTDMTVNIKVMNGKKKTTLFRTCVMSFIIIDIRIVCLCNLVLFHTSNLGSLVTTACKLLIFTFNGINIICTRDEQKNPTEKNQKLVTSLIYLKNLVSMAKPKKFFCFGFDFGLAIWNVVTVNQNQNFNFYFLKYQIIY